MLAPAVVDRIRELSGQGLGSKRIARELGVSRNSVRRYLAGATVGFQERPAGTSSRRRHAHEVQRLFRTVAEGNAVVIQQELATGVDVDLRTMQRAVATLRQEERAEAWPQSDSRPRRVNRCRSTSVKRSCGSPAQPVKVYLMTAVLGYSRRLYCRAFLAQRQDDWLEGIDGAFRHFGGLTEQILCDNASPLVMSHDRQSGQVVWNPGFEAFCRDRGMTPRPVVPAVPAPRGRSNAASATSSTMPWPGDRLTPSRNCSGTWRGGWSRSPIGGFTAPPRSSPLFASSATSDRRCGLCRLAHWRSARAA